MVHNSINEVGMLQQQETDTVHEQIEWRINFHLSLTFQRLINHEKVSVIIIQSNPKSIQQQQGHCRLYRFLVSFLNYYSYC